MKKVMITLLTLLLSLTCLAGSSDEDPVVAAARKRFSEGLTPRPSFLVENKFQCKVLYALRGMFDKVDSGQKRFKLDEATGSLKTSEWNGYTSYVVLDQEEVWGIGEHRRTNCSIEVAYRLSRERELISETTSKRCFNANEVDSPISPKLSGKVLYYTVCQVKD